MIRLSHGTYFGALLATHEVAGLRISENAYVPHERIPMHVHTHPFICLVVAGGFAERSGRHTAECMAGSVIWHPEGEAHEDRFTGNGGACVELEFDGAWLARLGEAELLPRRWTLARGGAPTWLASRIASELPQADDVAPLALEGLTCALVAELARTGREVPARRPPWLDRGIARLRDEFRSPPSIAALTADAGVHRSHFVRTFHRHMGCTVGEYVRRLRIDWACDQLRRSDDRSLADIALMAGFADQPHFSRTFRRVTGTTPRAFRSRWPH